MKEEKALIYKQIALVMKDIGAIGISKNDKNIMQGYKFRGIDAVYNALNPLLSKHGIICVPTVIDQKREERKTKNGGVLIYTILTIDYTFYAADGSHIVARVVGEAMDSGDKSCNKAMSAGQKYAYFQVFSIPTEESKDTENDTHEVVAEEKPQTKTKNFEFLKYMNKEKKRLGDKLYYETLGGYGYEHANEITERDNQEMVFKKLGTLPEGEINHVSK